MENEIDARGLTCPAPVLKVRELIEAEAPQEVKVVVDNQAARENVTRFLGSQGYLVSDSSEENIFRLIGRREGVKNIAETKQGTNSISNVRFNNSAENQKILVLIMTDKIGSGDDSLGSKLMVNYIKTLNELGETLWQLIFVNGGVRFTCKKSPVIEELKKYESCGTTILSCGTCMEHFGLTAEKDVGGLTNMLDIVMAQQNADKVITLG